MAALCRARGCACLPALRAAALSRSLSPCLRERARCSCLSPQAGNSSRFASWLRTGVCVCLRVTIPGGFLCSSLLVFYSFIGARQEPSGLPSLVRCLPGAWTEGAGHGGRSSTERGAPLPPCSLWDSATAWRESPSPLPAAAQHGVWLACSCCSMPARR